MQCESTYSAILLLDQQSNMKARQKLINEEARRNAVLCSTLLKENIKIDQILMRRESEDATVLCLGVRPRLLIRKII